MASNRKPLWRQIFDAVDGIVTPQLEAFVRSEQFCKELGRFGKAQAFLESQARDASARMWHILNLPAGSDISRLRKQLGALDREVRRLTLQLEQERQAPESPAVPLKEKGNGLDAHTADAA
ncbi:hypothetical protein CLV47_104211 [Antricoccus suffuscus]|uniref:Poly(3-hydroxyalkanoate) polymerase subunit PhaE n=1 Tax=Antricoccus suffuscus TaxID=1629062 RepID=A0A2T1A2Q0_9ACTN|nr:hypothetical protein [Antricoccus suffuscus]PRZ42863.1 hypothetical protein CLV47_104211 [Antricoccus suffuscus]